MHYTGEVHFLPPDEATDGDDKERRHVLLTDCGDDEICSFAYASTQSTEADHGAANRLVNPVQGTYRGTGFEQPTYVYPSRLVAYESGELTAHDFVGRLMDDVPPLRDQLRYALGIGTGTADGSGAAYGSYRGRIAVVSRDLYEASGWEFAIVVTEPLYSKQRRFQTVIPIFDAEEYSEAVGLLPMNEKPWLANLGFESAWAFVPFVSSLFHPREIEEIAPITVDEGTMDELDFALKVRFAL